MDFDALRAAVVPGTAVVGRWPGVVCVAECADRQVLRRLLDVCASSAGVEPGRALARRLAMWLGGPDAPGDGLRFGTVAVATGDVRSGGSHAEQWAVFLYGPVGLVVPDRQVALSGAQSVAWTDRLMPRPDTPVVLALEGGPIPPGVVDGVHDLRVGIVPGAGAVLVPGGEQTPRDTSDDRARSDEPRWPGPDRPWGADAAISTPADGLHPGDTPGNGLPPRGSAPFDGGGHRGPDASAGPDRPGGRPHLRPVPSGTNGVAHRGWVPRRGSAVDLGRFPDAGSERATGAAGDDGAQFPVDDPVELLDDRRPAGRDEHRGPGGPTGGGEPHDPDPRHRGVNGARTNGAVHDLLGGDLPGGDLLGGDLPGGDLPGGDLPGRNDVLPTESERSPWSDGRDAGRPDRIEGWFATRDDAGTEVGLRAVGPAEGRRRRHRRSDDTGRNGTGQNGVPRNGVPQDGTAEDGTAHDGTAHDGTAHDGSAHDGSAHDGTAHDGTAHDEHERAGTVEHGSGIGPGPADDHLGADDFGSADDYRDHRGVGRAAGDAAEGRALGGGDFGTGSVEETRLAPVAEPRADGEDLDGASDGTPRLGVPAQEAPEPAAPHPLDADGGDREATHTTALRSERILGVAPAEPERAALDEGPVTGGLAVGAQHDDPEVRGYLCPRGHLNDPRAQFCAMCGTRMEEQAGPPAPGPRPPLGLLVFDDGATYTVDAEYLMGRMPEADPRVASGELRSLALEDTSGAVSRVHAQIVVNGWDALLVDAGSRNGTFVSPPGEQGWTQLPAGETHRLVPGTRVRIGGRSFLFESPSGTR